MSESNVTPSTVGRVCHVIKRENFDGYGFNLHAERGKPGQYIGKVDEGSPAEEAGLREGDRIIEVNSVNIGNESHKQVVQRIKAIANEVRLLVVDHNVKVSKNNEILLETSEIASSEPEATTMTTTKTTATTIEMDPIETATNSLIENEKHQNGVAINDNNNDKVITTSSTQDSNNSNNNGSVKISNDKTEIDAPLPPKPVESKVELHNNNNNNNNISSSTINGGAPKAAPVISESPTKSSESSLNLKMTAAEMRAKLAAKKKYDPKKESVDLRQKYDIIQKM